MNAYSQITAAAPVAFDVHLADAWRGSLLEVEDHIRFIHQHQETIKQQDEMLLPGIRRHKPSTVEGARENLAYRLPRYAKAIRRVTEAEERMSRMGMQFAQSSYAWGQA